MIIRKGQIFVQFHEFYSHTSIVSVSSDTLYTFPTQMKGICNKEIVKGEKRDKSDCFAYSLIIQSVGM